MNNKEFFNKNAFNWDSICNHEPKKLRKIIELSKLKTKSKILDIGTGTGVLLEYLLPYNPIKITAIDISENMITLAKSKFKDNRISFVNDDILNFSEIEYDYAFLYSVYPHFKDKQALFNKLYSLLSKNGKIIIAHSESKEKINAVHLHNACVKNDILTPVESTAKIMSKHFKVQTMIDNEDMYYIDGIKQS